MNKLHPKKLLHSKWTAVKPENKEKHFVVSEVEYDEEGAVTLCSLEAVFSKRIQSIDWRVLTDPDRWQQGWL